MTEASAPQTAPQAAPQTVPHDAHIGSMGVENRKLGMWLLIASEVVFFSALIVTYLVMHGRTPNSPAPRDVLNVPLTGVNTFVLICSSLTMVTALARVQQGDARGMRLWLIATAVLGLLFLGGQAYEFTSLMNEGLSLSANLLGSSFFTLTGFHGAHVFAGVVWIVMVLARAFRGGITQGAYVPVELLGLYWHFVDLVWIIIFTIVYLI